MHSDSLSHSDSSFEKRVCKSQSLTHLEDRNTETCDYKKLEDELKRLKERLGRPCEMCSNYEMQLQMIQQRELNLTKKLHESEKIIESRKNDLRREESFRVELEEKFAEEAKQVEKKISELNNRFETSSNELAEMRNLLTKYYSGANEKIARLTASREQLAREVKRLFNENESLLGKHLAKSEALQAEVIDLPQKLEDVQFYCLKLKEDLITALIAKERNEETFHSEILFLKEQNTSEQQSRETLVLNLTQDNDALKSNLEILENKYIKLKEKSELQEKKLLHTESMLHENQNLMMTLQREVNDLTNLKLKLEEENTSLKSKVQSFQNDLDKMEQVQKDFVKLSQSLQVQLEVIRQSDTEVRWQHDEDIRDCNGCKKTFHSKKEKHHCSHCGKIFCDECNSYHVYGGPNNRCFKVCNVCHTLLNRHTAPYFSNEPPQSPT